MGSRKYYQHVEKDPENIKSIWKVLHSATFLLLIFNSLISAYVFGDILKMFNYRCVLHVAPTFDLLNGQFLNESYNELLFFEPVIKNIVDNQTTPENETATATKAENNNSSTAPENGVGLDTSKPKREENKPAAEEQNPPKTEEGASFIKLPGLNFVPSEKKADLSDKKVHKEIKKSYIYNETVWYKNDTMYGEVRVKIRGSDYGATTSCDLVLFVPLVSLIAAAAFGALTVLFGRGQVSERSWFMVYPVLIASAIMTILCTIATISMRNGLEDFCSKFQHHTGFVSCSRYMDYFSYNGFDKMTGFWDDYIICYYSYIVSILLWAIQLLITILRLSTMADFQFMAVTIHATERSEEHDDKLHKVLVNSGMKPAEELFPSSEEDVSASASQQNVSTL